MMEDYLPAAFSGPFSIIGSFSQVIGLSKGLSRVITSCCLIISLVTKPITVELIIPVFLCVLILGPHHLARVVILVKRGGQIPQSQSHVSHNE